MKTITIRDLRQRWPEAEAALQVEDEILITRDSKPVAKLVRFSSAAAKRPRWNVKAHARWQKKVSGGKISSSDAALQVSREERAFRTKPK
jgi:antitoxin (DNA-binding transcriptional repressor) of toxin-antitoxin stability system